MEVELFVAGFIYADGKVLAAKRAATKRTAPGVFHLPGGRVEHGEAPSTALAREIREELGLSISVDRIFDVVSYVTPPGTHWVGLYFLCTPTSNPAEITTDPADTEEVRWLTSSELPEFFTQNDDHNLRMAQRGFEELEGVFREACRS